MTDYSYVCKVNETIGIHIDYWQWISYDMIYS